MIFFLNYFWNTELEEPLSAQSLMNSYEIVEANTEGDVDGAGVAHEVSEDNKDIINNWTMGHSCSILAKNCDRWSCGAEEAAVIVKKV